MALIDDVGEITFRKLARQTSGAGIQYAPKDARFDWIKGMLDRIEQLTAQRNEQQDRYWEQVREQQARQDEERKKLERQRAYEQMVAFRSRASQNQVPEGPSGGQVPERGSAGNFPGNFLNTMLQRTRQAIADRGSGAPSQTFPSGSPVDSVGQSPLPQASGIPDRIREAVGGRSAERDMLGQFGLPFATPRRPQDNLGFDFDVHSERQKYQAWKSADPLADISAIDSEIRKWQFEASKAFLPQMRDAYNQRIAQLEERRKQILDQSLSRNDTPDVVRWIASPDSDKFFFYAGDGSKPTKVLADPYRELANLETVKSVAPRNDNEVEQFFSSLRSTGMPLSVAEALFNYYYTGEGRKFLPKESQEYFQSLDQNRYAQVLQQAWQGVDEEQKYREAFGGRLPFEQLIDQYLGYRATLNDKQAGQPYQERLKQLDRIVSDIARGNDQLSYVRRDAENASGEAKQILLGDVAKQEQDIAQKMAAARELAADMPEIVKWAFTEEGWRFIERVIGVHKLEQFLREPYKTVAFDAGLQEWLPKNRDDLPRFFENTDWFGMPRDIAQSLLLYYSTPEAKAVIREREKHSGQGPVATFVTDLTGSRLIGDLASLGLLFVPYVGAPLYASEVLIGTGSPLQAGLALVATAGGAKLQQALVKNLSPETQSTIAKLATRIGIGAATNTAVDFPYNYVYLREAGASPGQALKGAAQVAPASAALGAAPESSSLLSRFAIKNVTIPPEVTTGLLTYSTLRLMGFDDEEAKLGAVAMGGMVRGKRIIEGLTDDKFISMPNVPVSVEDVQAKPQVKRPRLPEGERLFSRAVTSADELPPTVYHVTTSAKALREAGELVPPTQVIEGRTGPHGLGFITEKEDAHNLAFELARQARIARGEIKWNDLKAIVREDEVRARTLKNRLSPAMRAAYALTTQEVQQLARAARTKKPIDLKKPALPENVTKLDTPANVLEVYRNYTILRGLSGGLPGPLITMDIDLLKRIDPNDVAVVGVPSKALFSGAEKARLYYRKFPFGGGEVTTYGSVPIAGKGVQASFTKDLGKYVLRETVGAAVGAAAGYAIGGDTESAIFGALLGSALGGKPPTLPKFRIRNPELAKQIEADAQRLASSVKEETPTPKEGAQAEAPKTENAANVNVEEPPAPKEPIPLRPPSSTEETPGSSPQKGASGDDGDMTVIPGGADKEPPLEPEFQRVKDEMDAFLQSAKAQASSRRIAGKVTGPLGRILDPAVQFKTPAARSVHEAAIAASNLVRSVESVAPITLKQGPYAALGPLMNESLKQHLKKAAIEAIGPVAAGAVAYLNDGEFGGPIDELLIFAGAMYAGGIAQAYRAGWMRERPWMKIQLKPEYDADPVLPEIMRKDPTLKFIDIIERPYAYDLTPQQAAALDAFQKLRDQVLEETNRWRWIAGSEPIPYNPYNMIHHSFDRKSIEKQFHNKPDVLNAIRVQTADFTRELPLERARDFGDTWYDILQAYPDLRPSADVPTLIAEELRQHAKIRGHALISYALKNNPNVAQFVGKNNPRREVLLREYWGTIAGEDGWMFAPEVIDAVNKLFLPSKGSAHPVMDFLDILTNNVRTAVFTADFSAWTMQGAMLFVNNPFVLARNFFDLLLGSLSSKYYEWWLARNSGKNAEMIKEAARSGVIPGFEFEALERRGNVLSNVPLIRHLEDAGFQRFLPMMRTLMYENMRNQEAIIQRAGKLKSVPPIGDVGMAITEAAKWLPAVGAGAAAYQATTEDGELSPMDMVITLAAGLMLGGLADVGVSKLGAAAYRSADKTAQAQIGARAGKRVNLTGGTINRQQYGISNVQAQVERVLGARSPALTRNTITLAKIALTDPGVDGAAARFYLIKTAALYTVAAALTKYMVTGEVDSFDPNDPQSVLNPNNAFRARMGMYGSLSASNPLVSLFRAALYQERPEGQREYDWTRFTDPAQLLRDKSVSAGQYISSRLPDVTGIVTRPAVEKFFGKPVSDVPEVKSEGVPETVAKSPLGATARAIKNVLPLSLQQALESGVIQKSALVPDMPDVVNPAFNTATEQALGVAAPFLGLNYTPESLSAESRRLRDDLAQKMFPDATDRTGDKVVGYDDLNRLQQEQVRNALKGGRYEEIQKTFEQQFKEQGLTDPINDLFKAMDSVNEWHKNQLQTLQGAYDRKELSPSEFRKALQKLNNEYRARVDQVQESLGSRPVGKPGVDMTVREWLNRNRSPEDDAVDEYYKLYDKAMVNGSPDFDKLEQMQQKYLDSLDPKTRAYVEEYLSSKERRSEFPAVQEYRQVVETLKPYWEIEDIVFNVFKRKVPHLFGEFNNAEELKKEVARVAAKYGIAPADSMAFMKILIPELGAYEQTLSNIRQMYRLQNPEVDNALVKWYDYTPADRLRYGGQQFGLSVPHWYSISLPQRRGANSVRNVSPVLIDFALQRPLSQRWLR